MSAGRRLPVFLAGVIAAAALTALMIKEGPRWTDLPPGVTAVPEWVTADPEHALITVVGLAAWACLLWLCAGFVLGVLATLPGAGGRAAAAMARRILPRTLRHVLEIALGITLAAGTAVPAFAATPTEAAIPGAIPSTSTAWPDLARPSVPTTLAPTDVPPAPQLAPSRDDQTATLQHGQPASSQAAPERPADTGHPSTPPPRAAPPAPISAPADPRSTIAATSWPDLSRPSAPADPAGTIPTVTTTTQPPAATPPATSAHPPATGTASGASTVSAERPTVSATAAQPPATTLPASPPAPLSPTVSAATGTSPVWPDLARPYDPITGAAPRGVGNSSAAPAGQPTTSTNTNDASTTDLAEIVVLRGDTLWAIAARNLGPGATTAQIAREWPRWWAANEHVIGPDPDRILPGQRLQPPRPGP